MPNQITVITEAEATCAARALASYTSATSSSPQAMALKVQEFAALVAEGVRPSVRARYWHLLSANGLAMASAMAEYLVKENEALDKSLARGLERERVMEERAAAEVTTQ